MKIKSRLILMCVWVLIGGLSVFAQTKSQQTEVKFGFLESFERVRGGFQIKVDYAQMFDGEAAEREAQKDGEPSPSETSGIYIRNQNPKIHTEKLSSNAVVIALKDIKPFRLTLAEFERLRTGKLKDADKFWGFPDQYGAGGAEPMPCYVTIKNGAITKIEQVYFP